MFCPKCGKQLEDQAKFCEGCGQDMAQSVTQPVPTPEPAPIPAPNVAPYAAPYAAQYAQAQNAPAPMNYQPVKKKKHIGGWIALIIILAIVGAAGWFAASFLGVLGPKNLGVTYTEKDFQSAMAKIGTQITFEGKSGGALGTDSQQVIAMAKIGTQIALAGNSGDALRTYSRQLKEDGTKYPIADYTWTHSDYQEKSFTLSSAEATAFLNEIAPAFWWFEDQQIHVLPGGMIEASGTALVKKAIEDLIPDLTEQIPIPMLEKVNLYAKGTISIKENKLELGADTFMTGPIAAIPAKTLNDNAMYLEFLYKSVPGLIIHSLTVNMNGGIDVSALIPQKTVIVRKVP